MQIGSASRRRRLQFCEPTGMRALAPCPWLAGSSSAVDGRRPERTLVARLRQPNHSQVSVSPVSHGPCMSLSSVLSAHYLKDKSPLWHKRGSHWACVVLPLREGNQHFVSSPVSLRWFLLPHTRIASALHLCKQLYSLCHGEGIFHGLICLATDDSLGTCHSHC